MFVFVFVLGLCRGCDLIGLWLVGRWWFVDLWVAMVCWCDCRGVIVVVVWWFACSISKKRETMRKREKKIEMMMLYMMNILL